MGWTKIWGQVITDNVYGSIGIIPKLDPDESYTFTITATAEQGQHSNKATVTSVEGASDTDLGYYFGGEQYEGLSLGYWKNHPSAWVGYSTSQKLSSVFTIPSALSSLANDSLMKALSYGGGSGIKGAAQNLFRAAVAALLNASHPKIDYPMTGSEVINAVNAALATLNRSVMLNLASKLDKYNNYGAKL